MGIFSRIFGIRKINNSSSDLDKKQNDNIVELLELKNFLDELLEKNQYISKREFLSSVDKKKDILHFFDVLTQSQMLENFCKSNRQSVQEITAALDECNKINEIIDFHNEQYIKIDFPIQKLDSFEYKSDKTITKFVEQLNEMIDTSVHTKISYKIITDWLKENDYLKREYFRVY